MLLNELIQARKTGWVHFVLMSEYEGLYRSIILCLMFVLNVFLIDSCIA